MVDTVGKIDNVKFSFLWNEWIKEIITSKFLTLFEPENRSIPGVRIGQARFVSGELGKCSDDTFIRFPNRYGRNTTLAGIWMFLGRDHGKEYLVTAFGKRRGQGLARPAEFCGLHVSYGTRHEVRFSSSCLDYFQKHIDKISNAEVFVCHNHPRNFVSYLLSQIADWGPLPSNTDRTTTFHFKYESIVRWLVTGNFANVRFFVTEMSRIREIRLPTTQLLSQIIMALKSMATSK
jgi:hypothetical protein